MENYWISWKHKRNGSVGCKIFRGRNPQEVMEDWIKYNPNRIFLSLSRASTPEEREENRQRLLKFVKGETQK